MTDFVHTEQRIFVSYIDKSREYYRAAGYDNPYRWAYHQDAPFTRLSGPLSECRVGLVTTASLWPDHGADGLDLPRVTFAAASSPVPERLYTMHRSWDKEATHTDDLDSFMPLNRLNEAVRAGRIASASPRFYGIPTEYSQRKTISEDAPAIHEMLREDEVDVALLVAL